EISSDKKFLVSQHISSVKHKSLAERKKQSASPSLIQMRPFLEASGKQSQFYVDLCDAFVSAGIPLRKLDSEKFSYFLEKYCGQQVPSSVTLRLHYLKNIYEKKLEFIRRCVSDKPIWVSIDETTDATGRYVANTVIGLLTATENRSFLLHAEDLERTNSSTVAQAFMNALSILWPGGVKHERVLLFVTDAAPYMTKAGKALKVIFPRMIHVTCVVHALHRVAEEVRVLFPDVDKLIANGKIFFLKSAARVTIFRETAPGVPLPPQPVLTRWGTWLEAALYYARNLNAFTSVVNSLDGTQASSIQLVQELLQKSSLGGNLSFIAAHFDSLPKSIEKLEASGIPLVESTELFGSAITRLKGMPGSIGKRISEKCDFVVSRNEGLCQLEAVAEIQIHRGRNPTKKTAQTLKDLQFLWQSEDVGFEDDLKDESREEEDDLNKALIDHFRETTFRDENGRYVLKLPFKSNIRSLENLKKDPIKLKAVDDEIKGYSEAGFAEKAHPKKAGQLSHYLPIQVVFKAKPDSPLGLKTGVVK
ncbi:uncharacterized protein LOC100905225, partial [Galendromus occidentalis]|uniref:Uncharacterized protein LOC100905225 n=1 Tax=Galendromus occidentalis TaxID=34638 RepID=A0AAJ6QQ21_9ACAR